MTSSLLLASAAEYVIERPRLLDTLEAADARLRMLIAPAGYGKTTLLRQWLAHHGTPYAWYAVGPEGSDVAAVAAKIATALGGILPGAGQRMLGRLGVSNDPEAEASIFADILSEELDGWPAEAVLAIDDYQELAVSSACERFVGRLLRHAPLKLALTSRRRPRWARARSLLYGESFLLGRHDLAMTREESRRVLTLGEWTDCDRLIELGGGWPAIVALAARSRQHPLPGGVLPPALYAYFAEELYTTLAPERQTLLCQLAATPRVTPALVDAVAGGTGGEELLAETEQLGFVAPHEQPDELVFHPLLRTFLEDKLRRHPDSRVLVTQVAHALLQQHRWDDAGELVRRFDRPDLLPELVEAALANALQGRRVSTLAEWITLAREKHVVSAVIDVAEAEVAFLAGDHGKARALGEQAASVLRADSPHASAANTLAGRAAYFMCAARSGMRLFQLAADTAIDQRQRQEALWGWLLCSIELEREPSDVLRTLSAENDGSCDWSLRIATAHLLTSCSTGGLHDALVDWGNRIALLPLAADPLARTGFLQAYAGTHVMSAGYAEAYALTDELIRELDANRLAFGAPYAYALKAWIALGLRRFQECSLLLDRVRELDRRDPWLRGRCECLRVAWALARATEPTLVTPGRDWPSRVRGEYYAIAALAEARRGNGGRVQELAELARATTGAATARMLSLFAEGVSDTVSDEEPSFALTEAYREASSLDLWDCIVWAYRAKPSVLRVFARDDAHVGLLQTTLLNAHDHHLARAAGITLRTTEPSCYDPLSPREQQVMRLLVEGLSNREIATRLFISDVTVKVHLHHIFEKLGARNRTEAVLKVLQPDPSFARS